MTSLAARFRPLWLLLIVALACQTEPGGPSVGSLRVNVMGLPGGSSAAITVTGPGGYSQSVTATQTLTPLTPGTYTVTATTVTAGGSQYAPSPPSQTVAVNGSASATVFYSVATGNLAVSISGLGSASTAAVTVTGPGTYSQAVAATTTLMGLDPGIYTVTARDTVATGGTPHTASPATQDVTVPPNGTGSATVTYTPPSGGPLNLRIAGLYITQSTQTYPATVPLVANRDGYLRVFVIANRTTTSTEVPSVRVRYYNGGPLPVDSTLIVNAQALSVPTTVDESSLSYTWNVPVSGSLIETGLSIQAEVDPANAVFESDEADNLFPAVGSAVADVNSVPTLRVTFVPIIQSASGLQGNVSNANKDAFLDMTRRMHPIDAVDAVVGQPYTTAWTLQADGTGWAELLFDFNAAIAADGRYHYGVVKVSYPSGVAGVAYVSQGSANARAALGWDALSGGSGSIVVAHELAHNWGRNHAPCGNPANPDPLYPQPDGSIGSYGLDVTTSTLKPSSLSDIMGYCALKWIGEYSYRGVMDYRSAHPLVMATRMEQTVQPSLLVWGRIRDGELILEPAFQVNTRPRLPARPGPYSVEARADDGSTLFNLSFTPNMVADAPGNQQHFAFAVPLASAKAARLSSLRLTGGGKEVVRHAQAGIQPDSVQLRRTSGGRVGLRWNVGAHPVVMVRDAETGQVLSFARGGDAQISTSKGQVDLLLSDGVRSKVRRVRVRR